MNDPIRLSDLKRYINKLMSGSDLGDPVIKIRSIDSRLEEGKITDIRIDTAGHESRAIIFETDIEIEDLDDE